MKTWFITGASRGFGARIAELALAKGDNVVATARNPKGVTDGKHKNLLAVALDVTDEAQAKAAADAAVERFGRIDVLLNNAGFGLLGAVEEAAPADVEAVYRTNVFGLLAVTRSVLPYMRAARSGRILNISSIGGYRGGPGFGVYSSTKFAVEGLSEALHAELAPLGIHVTVIEPGYFRTPRFELAFRKCGPDRRLCRNGRRREDASRGPQPCAAGRSGQACTSDRGICRCAEAAGPVAARQRYRCGHRGEACG